MLLKGVILSDLNDMQASSGAAANLRKIQIMKAGKFSHPVYGPFDLNAQVFGDLKKNFDEKVRKVDLPLDYYHESDKSAAGWFKELELSQDGNSLWATVEFTPRASKMISDKELKYFSPDFAFEWEDPETGVIYKNVLFGGGLTNRPFLKGMEPIELDEPTREALHKALDVRSKKYGIEVAEDANLTPPAGQPTDADAYGDPVNYKFPMPDKAQASNARVRFKQFANSIYKNDKSRNIVHERIVRKELSFGVEPSFDPKDSLDSALPSDLKNQLSKGKGDKMGLKEILDGLKKLTLSDADKSELHTVLAEVAPVPQPKPDDEMAALKKQLEDLQAKCAQLEQEKQAYMAEKEAAMKAKQMAEKEAAFTKLLSEGKAVVAQKEAFLTGDMDKFIQLAQPTNMGGKGKNENGEGNGDLEDRILKLAEEKCKADSSLTVGEAISLAKKELK